MPRSIKNDNRIIIDRKFIKEGIEISEKIDIGSYYFEASIDMKQLSIQLFLNEILTDDREIKQVEDIYIKEYNNFASDSSPFGWTMLSETNK